MRGAGHGLRLGSQLDAVSSIAHQTLGPTHAKRLANHGESPTDYFTAMQVRRNSLSPTVQDSR